MSALEPDNHSPQEPEFAADELVHSALPALPAENPPSKKSLVGLLVVWVGRYLLAGTCLTLLALLAVLWSPPEYLLNWGLRFAENKVLDSTGLPLKIGRIQHLNLRLQRQFIQIQNIQLYGFVGARHPLLVIPQVNIQADLLAYLQGQEGSVQIQVLSPRVSVQRDAEGRLNLRPKMQASENKKPEQKQEPPRLPRVQFLLQDALLQYRDQSPKLPLKEALVVPELRGDLQEGQLAAALRVWNPLMHLGLVSGASVFKGQGWARLHLGAQDLSKANAYARLVPDLHLQRGHLAGVLDAQWQSWQDFSQIQKLHYRGVVKLHDFQAQVPYFRPEVKVQAQVHLNQHQVQIDDFDLRTGKSQIRLRGSLQDYLQKLTTKLAIDIPYLDLGSVLAGVRHPALKALQAQRPQGNLRAQIELQGPLQALQATGAVHLPHFAMEALKLEGADTAFDYRDQQAQGQLKLQEARWQDVRLQHLLTHYHYAPDHFSLANLQAQLFSGALQGQARIGLGKTQTLNADLKGHGLELKPLLQQLHVSVPQDYRPAGRVNFQVRAEGPLQNPRAQGQLSAPDIRFPDSRKLRRVQNLRTDFSYSKALTQAQLSADSQDAGTLKARLNLRQLNQMHLQLSAQKIPLEVVNAFAPAKYIQKGHGSLNAELQGGLKQMQKNWMAFDGAVHFKAQDLGLDYTLAAEPQKENQRQMSSAGTGSQRIQQELDHADLDLKWHQGQAEIQHLSLQRRDSHLEAQGQVSVPGLMAKAKRQHAVTGKMHGQLNLEDFPFLQQYQVAGGHVQLALQADTQAKGGLQASLRSQASDLMVRGITLDQVHLDTDLEGQDLTIHKADLQQDGDKLSVQGQVKLGGHSPRLDLQARSENFDLQTLVTLLPPEIRERLSAKKESHPTLPRPDHLPDVYRLPQIESRQTFMLDKFPASEQIRPEDLDLNWRELMKHWERWKRDPVVAKRKTVEASPDLLEDLQGKLSLQAHISGTVAEPEVKLNSVLEQARIKDTGLSETLLKANFKGKVFNIDRFYMLDDHGGTLEAHGKVDLDRDMNVEVKGRGIRLKLARPFLPQQTRLEGSVNFLAVAEGQPSNPQVTAEMDISRLLLNQLFFDKLSSLAGYEEGYLKDARVELRSGDQSVVANGDVPVPDLNKPMDVTLQLEDDSFGLINLFTSAIDWRKGKGSVLLRLVGPPHKPQLEGSIRMDDTEVYLPALKESVTGLKVRGELLRRKDEFGELQQNVELNEVSGHFGGGTVSAKGSMDLLNLLPSYFDLETEIHDVTVRYLRPGLFETVTPIDNAKIRIMGLVSQPIISGKIHVGKNGQTVFPFLRSKADLQVSSDVGDAQQTREPDRFLFGGLKVYLPENYHLNSPIFDIPVTSEKGINLLHRAGRITLAGDVSAKEGTIYVLNNALNIENLDVHFRRPETRNDPALNPSFDLAANWNVEGVSEPVKVDIRGSLEQLRKNELKFDFSNTQGLTESDLLARLFGIGAVQKIGQEGGLQEVASQFSDQVLRGLFDPLTSRFSKLLGLEELSFGLAGQSTAGPIFKFKIRSNPFFAFDDYIDEQLPQISFVNKIRLSAEGRLGEQSSYDLGSYYRFNEHWALDYKYEQQGSVHNVKVSGSYLLDYVLKWMNSVRSQYFGWDKPQKQGSPAAEKEKGRRTRKGGTQSQPQSGQEAEQVPSYSTLLDPETALPSSEPDQHFQPGSGLW